MTKGWNQCKSLVTNQCKSLVTNDQIFSILSAVCSDYKRHTTTDPTPQITKSEEIGNS